MIVVAALTRLLPHPPNFSPVEAIALFGGAYFASRQWAMVVPLLAMLVSDLALGVLHGASYASYLGGVSFWSVYACIALSVVLGFGLRGKVSGGRVLGYSLAGSVLFFVVTNFAAWLSDPLYPKTGAGLAACYAAGIPFFRWTVLGTLFYSARAVRRLRAAAPARAGAARADRLTAARRDPWATVFSKIYTRPATTARPGWATARASPRIRRGSRPTAPSTKPTRRSACCSPARCRTTTRRCDPRSC